MSHKKHNKSLLSGLLGPGGGLSASWRMALGGGLWLAASLALALWLGRGNEDPFRADGSRQHKTEHGHARTLESAAANAFQNAHARLAALDMAAEETMSAVLSAALWQREILPAAPAAAAPVTAATAGSHASGPGNLPGHSGIRVYTITGPCAPLRLGLALLDRFSMCKAEDWPFPKDGPTGGTKPPTPPELIASAGAKKPEQDKKTAQATVAPDTFLLRDGNVRLRWTSDAQLEIRDHGRLTHLFRFPGREGELAGLDMPLPRPALALIIDDMGQSMEAAGALAALPYAVTLAVWPHAPQAKATVELAAQRRMDVLVHVPMEALPRKDGSIPNPGQGALSLGMEPHHMLSILAEDLAALPTAVGMNNHMGSALTSHAAACRMVCTRLAGTGFFLLDSVTSPTSLLAQEARAQGLVSASRDVFLDTQRQTPAILKALDQAAARARSRGYAIAIGHPYAETLSALRAWQDKEGVALVPLRRLIWSLALEKAETANGTVTKTANETVTGTANETVTGTTADSALPRPIR